MARAEFLAGFASEIITPDLGCPLAGFDARKGVATGVHDDLYSRALVFDDGATKVALVSIDVLGVSREFADGVRAAIERRTGIPAAQYRAFCDSHSLRACHSESLLQSGTAAGRMLSG